MPSTTLHIPASLLEVVDNRARTEGISRNRFILNALQRALAEDDAWSPGFFSKLREPLPKDSARAVQEMVDHIVERRSSKPAPRL
ncbi:MAG: hypothetical protein AMXMBFR33_68070 [Candidatus Xenobia bacterium]